MKERIEQVKDLIKNLKSTDKGRALLFFCGYLIFFLFLFVFIKTSSKVHLNRSDFESGSQIDFNVEKIKNNNYSYRYTITIDVNDYIFVGRRNNNYELLKYEDNDYFINYSNNVVKKLENGKWIDNRNPNDFSYFVNIDNIIELITQATYLSKTDYESGKVTYTYEISTTTIEKIINDVDIDLDDKPNEIIFSTDEDENVDSIRLEFDNYGKYKGNCKKYLTIEINYDDFGEIDNIKNPIE